MEQPEWVVKSKTIWIAVAGLLVALLPIVPVKFAVAGLIIQSVLVIGNRIFGGSGINGAHKPVVMLRP